MWISPEGYGSISSTYAFGRSGIGGVAVAGDRLGGERVLALPDPLPLGLDGRRVVPFRQDSRRRRHRREYRIRFEDPMTTTRPPVLIREADVAEHFEGIIALYRAHGWTHAGDPQRLRIAIERSSFSVVALEEDRVVGFARAMSDEAFAVYIADILVAPDRQRLGIGRTLAESILEHYPMDHVPPPGAGGRAGRRGLLPAPRDGAGHLLRPDRLHPHPLVGPHDASHGVARATRSATPCRRARTG